MSTTYVKSIEAEGIFGRFDFKHKFEGGINIVYGKNGAGKTTLLHILANALSGDFGRFNNLDFKNIKIRLSNKKVLSITKKKENGKSTIEATLNKDVIYPLIVPSSEYLQQEIQLIEKRLYDYDIRYKKYGLKSFVEDENKTRAELERLQKELVLQRNNLENTLRNEIVHKSDFGRKYKSKVGPLLSVAYFPAFRTMIEAWAATNKEVRPRVGSRTYSDEWKSKATELARDWFGEFIPTVNFPSLIEIEDQLTSEIFHARLVVGNKDREMLSEAFLKIFASLSEPSKFMGFKEDLLPQIQDLFSQLEASPMGMGSTPIYPELRSELDKMYTLEEQLHPSAIRILDIYRTVLESSLLEQQRSFESIENYIGSVNEFLEDEKSLAYKLESSSNRQSWLGVRFEDGSFIPGLRTLSSGERQILTLIYASTHMSQQNVVLIDEPEISLHIDWQRRLLSKMAEHIGERQIIACTHSPVIAADYPDQMKELQFTQTQVKTKVASEYSNEEEIPF